MGTKAQLGVQMESGEILGCYIHYDGYPSHMIPAIEDYVQRFSTTGLVMLIVKAIKVGGIRCFNIEREGYSDKLEEPPFIHRETDFLDDRYPFKIDETTWEDYEDLGADHIYLVSHETGEINVNHKIGETNG